MTAKEARQLVEDSKPKLSTADILKLIEKCAKDGYYRCHIYAPLKKNVISELESLGYQLPPVGNLAEDAGIYYTIMW